MSLENKSQERKKAIIADLNKETSKMPWSQMQKFFASGSTIYVSNEFDLLDIASDLVMDNNARIKALMDDAHIHNVNDEQAAHWLSQDTNMWVVVLEPYVLVQPVQAKPV